MRPREKSWLQIFLFSQLLIPIVGTINWILDANYMYICNKPIVDNPLLIGEWPIYLIFIEPFKSLSYSICLAFELLLGTLVERSNPCHNNIISL